MSAGLVPSGGSWPFFIFCCGSALLGLWSLPLSSKQMCICHFLLTDIPPISYFLIDLLASLSLGPSYCLRPTLIILGKSPHLKILNLIASARSPFYGNTHRVLGIRRRACLGDCNSASHITNGRKWILGSTKD